MRSLNKQLLDICYGAVKTALQLVENLPSTVTVKVNTVDDVENLARNSFMAAFMDSATSFDYLQHRNKVSQLRWELFNQ